MRTAFTTTGWILLVLVLSFTSVSSAAETTSTSTIAKQGEAPLSPEDVKVLREGAQMLRDIMSGKQPVPQPTRKEDPQKNMADVADRALSMLSGYISSAEQAFKKVAPEVWRIMIRQQYAQAIVGPLFPTILGVGIGIYVSITKKWWKNPDHKSDEWWTRTWLTSIIPMVAGLLCLVWLAGQLASSIVRFVNPEYYAFKDLLQIVLNRGGM